MVKKAVKRKRGRPPGSKNKSNGKVGAYNIKNLSRMMEEIKELRARVAKMEKVLN